MRAPSFFTFVGHNIGRIERAVIILALGGAVITLALGGSVRPETIRIVDLTSSTLPTYGEVEFATIVGYNENFSGWQSSESDHIISSSSSLILRSIFQNTSLWTSVTLFKSVAVDIATYPILDFQVNLTKGVRYGIRLFAQHLNGTEYGVWWEGSALDHRPSVGFEVVRANVQRHALLATGRQVQKVTKLEVYVENPPNTPQNFQFVLSKLHFAGETISDDPSYEYRATYVDLRTIPHGNASWYLNKVNFGAMIQATAGSVFTVYLFDGALLFGSTTAMEITYNTLTSFSEYTFYPNIRPQIFPELLPQSKASIVFVVSSGSVKDVELNYLTFIFLPAKEVPIISQQSLALYYSLLIFFLFLLPLGLAILVFHEFFWSDEIGKASVAVVLFTGLVCRVALAATTAHVFDMNVMLTSTRGWFQFGTSSGSLGPTLPLTFFLYWMAYSPYSLSQIAGFQDFSFLGHAAGVVEGIFVKLFPILADILTFFLLLRFRAGGRTFVWATFYLLNPLAIFTSSIWGQYEAATMAFIVWGIYCTSHGRFLRAAIAFVVSGMIQLLGFLPYALLLLIITRAKRYPMMFGSSLVSIIALVYFPQADLTFRLLLSLTGFIKGQYTRPGSYSLFGNLAEVSTLSQLQPLLFAAAIILGGVSVDTLRRKMSVERLVFYTAVSSVAFLLFSNLLAGWLWLLPIGLLYAVMREKEDLGVFMLVFGTSMAFLVVSNTTGSAYLLFGNVGYAIQPAIEGVRNQLRIFTVMAAALGTMFLFYLRFGSGKALHTLVATSAITFSLYLLLYFWLAVYPP